MRVGYRVALIVLMLVDGSASRKVVYEVGWTAAVSLAEW